MNRTPCLQLRLIGAALLAAVPAPFRGLAAQQPVLAPGAVVRWYDGPTGARGEGKVETVQGDSIVTLAADSVRRFRLSLRATTSLEIRDGHPSAGHRALIGLGIGVLGGGLLGYAAGQDCSAPGAGWFCISHAQGARLLGVLFGGLGALVGAVSTPQWKWVPVNELTAPVKESAISPLITWRNGAELGVRIRF